MASTLPRPCLCWRLCTLWRRSSVGAYHSVQHQGSWQRQTGSRPCRCGAAMQEPWRSLNSLSTGFGRAMLGKRCRHAVSVHPSVCLSVCHVREFCQKRVIVSSKFFHHSSFSVPNVIAIFRREPLPLKGASNAGGVGTNRHSRRIAGYRSIVVDAATARCYEHGGAGPWQVVTLRPIAGSKRRSLLMAGDDDEMFMTRSLRLR